MHAPTEQNSSNDRLSFTFFVAAAFHAMVIFGVGFSGDNGSKIAPILNVTLATHKSNVSPEKADFLAQFNQEASGTANTIKELSALQESEVDDVNIQEISPLPLEKASTQSENRTRVLTTSSQKNSKVAKQAKPNSSEDSEEKQGEDIEAPLISTEYASLKAKLDTSKQDLANQPRIRRLTSVSTMLSYDAKYLHAFAQKVERIGNKNFPEEALSKEIFGYLRLAVIISPNGTVDDIVILQPSKYPILDQAALQIVKLASPFEPFPPEIRKNTDKLEIIRTWKFEITGLSTTNIR